MASSRRASCSAIVAPPNTPVRIPTSVMPIWTVDRNSVERCDRSMTARARRSPRSALDCSRALRAEMIAISESEKTPFAMMSATMRMISRAMSFTTAEIYSDRGTMPRTPRSGPHTATNARMMSPAMKPRYIPALGRDLWTPAYDLAIRLTLPERRFKQRLLDAASITEDMVVVDVGCGTGTLLLMGKAQHTTAYFVGVDPDP